MLAAVLVALVLAIVLTVLALGLRSSFDDATYLLRRPGQLARALLAMNVVVPVFAAVMIAVFSLRPVVRLALVALAVSPIPPLLPTRALKVGGRAAPYTIGLLVAAAVLSIAFVPAAIFVFAAVFGHDVGVSPLAVARVVLVTVLGPLAVGVLVHRFAPRFAEKVAVPVSTAGKVLLLAGILPVLVVSGPAMLSLLGSGTLASLVAMSAAGLAFGHLLGGPDRDDRAVLALTTSSRHPGVAVAIAAATFPQQTRPVIATVLLYLLVNLIVSIPYQLWSKRRHARLATAQ